MADRESFFYRAGYVAGWLLAGLLVGLVCFDLFVLTRFLLHSLV